MENRIEFAKRGRRSRFEAWVLETSAPSLRLAWGKMLATSISEMTGTIVEIGPGTGVNLEYYAPGVHLIAIEPNPHMHPKLRAAADRHGVDLEIRGIRGERLDLADGSADGVVATLVLCGVESPSAVLAEVRRILKPGGRYVFVEHVVAPSGSWTRRVQRFVKRPHRWLFNGCEVDRDTVRTLADAGFSEVELTERDAGPAGAYVRHQVGGFATR